MATPNRADLQALPPAEKQALYEAFVSGVYTGPHKDLFTAGRKNYLSLPADKQTEYQEGVISVSQRAMGNLVPQEEFIPQDAVRGYRSQRAAWAAANPEDAARGKKFQPVDTEKQRARADFDEMQRIGAEFYRDPETGEKVQVGRTVGQGKPGWHGRSAGGSQAVGEKGAWQRQQENISSMPNTPMDRAEATAIATEGGWTSPSGKHMSAEAVDARADAALQDSQSRQAADPTNSARVAAYRARMDRSAPARTGSVRAPQKESPLVATSGGGYQGKYGYVASGGGSAHQQIPRMNEYQTASNQSALRRQPKTEFANISPQEQQALRQGVMSGNYTGPHGELYARANKNYQAGTPAQQDKWKAGWTKSNTAVAGNPPVKPPPITAASHGAGPEIPAAGIDDYIKKKAGADMRTLNNAYVMGYLSGYGPTNMRRQGYLMAYLQKSAQTTGSWRKSLDPDLKMSTVDEAIASKAPAVGAETGAQVGKAPAGQSFLTRFGKDFASKIPGFNAKVEAPTTPELTEARRQFVNRQAAKPEDQRSQSLYNYLQRAYPGK